MWSRKHKAIDIVYVSILDFILFILFILYLTSTYLVRIAMRRKSSRRNIYVYISISLEIDIKFKTRLCSKIHCQCWKSTIYVVRGIYFQHWQWILEHSSHLVVAIVVLLWKRNCIRVANFITQYLYDKCRATKSLFNFNFCKKRKYEKSFPSWVTEVNIKIILKWIVIDRKMTFNNHIDDLNVILNFCSVSSIRE